MARRLTTALAATGLLVLAISGSAGGHASSGIRGVLLDTTCAGACTPCAAASPCPPPCPPCTTGICPARPNQDAAIPCPASSSICTGCTPQSQPYTGPNAHVVVRRVSNGAVVKRRAPTDGNFKIRLARGHYRVHGFVSESCWQGETQQVAVHAGSFTALSLAVHNNCVATPQARAGR
jgi:hypothetical protein